MRGIFFNQKKRFGFNVRKFVIQGRYSYIARRNVRNAQKCITRAVINWVQFEFKMYKVFYVLWLSPKEYIPFN